MWLLSERYCEAVASSFAKTVIPQRPTVNCSSSLPTNLALVSPEDGAEIIKVTGPPELIEERSLLLVKSSIDGGKLK